MRGHRGNLRRRSVDGRRNNRVRGLGNRGADNRRDIGARDNRNHRSRSRDSSVTVRRVRDSGVRRENGLVTSGLLRSRS